MKSFNGSAPRPEDRDPDSREYDFCVAVGVSSPRARFRVSILLNIMRSWHVRYIMAPNEMADAFKECDLVIGCEIIAREAVLHRIPVIVVGDYGLGGLITPDTFCIQYDNNFRGRVNGMKDEYFPLEILEGEIKRSAHLTFQELQMMSNQIEKFLNDVDL